MDAPLLDPGLYIVATPIGNLGDVTRRAIDVLSRCAVIACEDTRVTGKLLHHLGIKRPLRRYDDHASDAAREALLGE
ncbi:MAG: rRNA (cytidine-2'-O-)-methyltransferase, partial [Novosphingobium sp.]|nr:rRNA (cytidine-2'-O-)-methyltransferase [Novosphingobium sp.]